MAVLSTAENAVMARLYSGNTIYAGCRKAEFQQLSYCSRSRRHSMLKAEIINRT